MKNSTIRDWLLDHGNISPADKPFTGTQLSELQGLCSSETETEFGPNCLTTAGAVGDRARYKYHELFNASKNLLAQSPAFIACRTAGIPLGFISGHMYANNADSIADEICYAWATNYFQWIDHLLQDAETAKAVFIAECYSGNNGKIVSPVSDVPEYDTIIWEPEFHAYMQQCICAYDCCFEAYARYVLAMNTDRSPKFAQWADRRCSEMGIKPYSERRKELSARLTDDLQAIDAAAKRADLERV